MGLIEALSRLDSAVLPRLARGLVRIRAVSGRTRIRPLTAVALMLVLAVAATAIWRLGEPPARPGGGPHFRVGVPAGMLISEYAAANKIELQRLTTGEDAARPVFALVSLRAYLDPDGIAALLTTLEPPPQTIWAYARVPIPRRQTEFVRLAADRLPADLIAACQAPPPARLPTPTPIVVRPPLRGRTNYGGSWSRTRTSTRPRQPPTRILNVRASSLWSCGPHRPS